MAAYLPHESATWRAIAPQVAHTNTDEILRSVEYSLRILTWMKTTDGSKNRKRPEPISFPWEKPKTVFEFDVMTTDEADEFLGWNAA